MSFRVSFLCSVVFLALAWPMGDVLAAPTVKVCVGDASGQKCVEAAPAGSSAVSTLRARALLNQAREALRDLRENGQRNGQIAADMKELDKLFKELQKRYLELVRSAKSGELDAKDALKGLAEARKGLKRLGDELLAQREAHLGFAKRVKRLERRRRLNLELVILAGGAWNYGATVSPLAVSLALPMGETGLWKARLTAGVGISPSVGVGWLAKGTMTRSFARGLLEIGPAVLGLGDEGDMLNGSRAWVMGAGAELRLRLGAAFVTLTPFAGVAMKRETMSVWHPSAPTGGTSSTDTPCPSSSSPSGGHWEEVYGAKRLWPAVGGLVGVGVALF